MSDGRNDRVHELLPAAYEQVRQVAAKFLGRRYSGRTLVPTALVHEAFLKIEGYADLEVKNRTHLVALMAISMRQCLIDHVRHRASLKQGGALRRVTLDTAALAEASGSVAHVEVLEDVLSRLEKLDPDAARIVELKFFGGLTEAEVAEEMGKSKRWVGLQWAYARAWIRRELAKG
jgi:RNA polymerase sigma factor (TIGR02999 family)